MGWVRSRLPGANSPHLQQRERQLIAHNLRDPAAAAAAAAAAAVVRGGAGGTGSRIGAGLALGAGGGVGRGRVARGRQPEQHVDRALQDVQQLRAGLALAQQEVAVRERALRQAGPQHLQQVVLRGARLRCAWCRV